MINNSDTIISHICEEYKVLNFYKNTSQIKSLSQDIELYYKDFMKFINMENVSDPYSYYKLYDPIYLNWKNKVSTLDEFNLQTVSTLTKIKIAHNQLKKEFNKKISFKELTKTLYDLYGSLNSLQESYSKFERDITPSKLNK